MMNDMIEHYSLISPDELKTIAKPFKGKVFKELWSDKYVSFNPYNINDLSKKIAWFIENKPVFDYRELIKKYSFEEMTKKTFTVYHSVTQNS